MKKVIDRAMKHWKLITTHFKKHHKKYLFGAFWWFAIVKMILLFLWLSPVLNIKNISAFDSQVVLNVNTLYDICGSYGPGRQVIDCSNKWITSIEAGTFWKLINSGIIVWKINLDNNNLTELWVWVFDWIEIFSNEFSINLSDNNLTHIVDGAFSWLEIDWYISLEWNRWLKVNKQTFEWATFTGNGSNRILLKNMDLTDEDIENINSLLEIPNLNQLWLNENNITNVDKLDLSKAPSLGILNLSHNNITNIDNLDLSHTSIYELGIAYNRIFDISNNTLQYFTGRIAIRNNCLSNSEVASLPNILWGNEQKLCLFTEYTPPYVSNSWTSWTVTASLTFTWKDQLVEEYHHILNNIEDIPFDSNTTKYFDVSDLSEYNIYGDDQSSKPWVIMNYPEDGQFPAEVFWLDNEEPICWERSYSPSLDTRSTWITATLSNSHDNDGWVWIDISGWTCLLDTNGVKCRVEIVDLVWNTTGCRSARPEKIDKESPTINFSLTNWTGSSFTITISGEDIPSWLQEENQLQLSYKRSNWNSTCDEGTWSSESLVNNQYCELNTEWLPDWTYYLCIGENSFLDKAWNGNEATSAGPFVLDTTAPECTVSSYSPDQSDWWTNWNVEATLSCPDWVTITNNLWSYTHLFTWNWTFIYTYVDEAGNTWEKPADVTWIDKKKPNCTWQAPTKTWLSAEGETGSITLNCTDTWAWINTNELHKTELIFDNGIIALTDNANTSTIENGISYTFIYTAKQPWNTSILLETWAIEDAVGNINNATDSDSISVQYGHPSAPECDEDLIEIQQSWNWNWMDEEDITITRNCWATWGYTYQNNHNTNINWNNINYTHISSWAFNISITGENHNNKYLCAFGQTWWNQITLCSQEIKVDRTDPSITLNTVSPANSWDTVTLSWSGYDWQSGISGYILKIRKPNNSTYTTWFTSWTTSTTYTVNKSGTWQWSITAYDNTNRSITDTGSFVVNYSWTNPNNNTWNLVVIQQSWNWNWTQQETITITWLSWATWGYRYQDTNDINMWWSWNTGHSWTSTISITGENHIGNGKYLCAFGQTWWRSTTWCSNYIVKVDTKEPDLDLLTPSTWASFSSGSSITFSWSGNDNGKSGISGYVLTITKPNNNTETLYFNSWTTSNTYIVNQSGTWQWSVAAYDNIGHHITLSRTFVVNYSWTNPNNGTWFFLISPYLWEYKNLWENITLSWHPGSINSGYDWQVENVSWVIIASWNTTWLTATINSGHFTTWAYSWSVKDIATDTTKSIYVFYVVDGVNTPSDLKVNQFEFDEIEDADLDEYYWSNEITIEWLSNGRYTIAYLWSWIWALYINWNFVWTHGFVKNWDEVYIEMKASDEYNETVKSTLFVWIWNDVVSWDFKITTQDWIHGRDNPSLTPMQKLWGIVFIDSLVEMYEYDEEKLATFLATFMQLLQDKSDYYASLIQEAEDDWDEELAQEYRLYKEAIDFLYVNVKYRYNNIEVQDRTIYIAPNGKQYLVEYDEDRMAYTSPDFVRAKYFPTWELFTNHIDINNPAVGKRWIVWNVITTHNGKVYTIYETNGKRTSSNFKTTKYFDTKEDIINHILANNPASDWNHKIDTDFDEVKYTAPNGKVYKIFRTSSKWNNPEMYSSYDFVDAKYFTSLEAAKKFIKENNSK